MKNIAVLTSGGDAPGMNAALRAIVLTCLQYKYTITGYYHGYNGLINGESKQIHVDDVNGIIGRGGTILKSARCPAMLSDNGIKQAVSTLMKDKIDALIVIGGDGSFAGLLEIAKYWQGQVIGIPGTIDNDVDQTDFTIGFSTAVNTAIEAIDKIRDTADAFERVFIVEVMGRHSGFITFNVGIASAAEQVLSFENFDCVNKETRLNELSNSIKNAQSNRHSSYLIVIAENLWPEGTTELAKNLTELTGIDCTPCILGYIQRGGSPVAKDRLLATKLGVASVQALAEGKTNLMMGEQNNTVVEVPLRQSINHQKGVSKSLIKAQTDILSVPKQSQI
ncbi:6-phosphofructokinase [Thalassotalea profundi]|uniref:6-phosphofructokinase n=1 Tax=Thalassotalea profundi TaxID=2036687 RepID=A0ABQ3IIP8_9GAMM|nr:ATP-dependent 6-phosphofructokinase [Thalassotalea profundi]GHE83270.1 ATP-dependent 6-phosphofructokinase 1 [Thalassotalea profundi]